MLKWSIAAVFALLVYQSRPVCRPRLHLCRVQIKVLLPLEKKKNGCFILFCSSQVWRNVQWKRLRCLTRTEFNFSITLWSADNVPLALHSSPQSSPDKLPQFLSIILCTQKTTTCEKLERRSCFLSESVCKSQLHQQDCSSAPAAGVSLCVICIWILTTHKRTYFLFPHLWMHVGGKKTNSHSEVSMQMSG